MILYHCIHSVCDVSSSVCDFLGYYSKLKQQNVTKTPIYLSASSIGSKLRSAVSLGSLNQDLMGIALSAGQNTVSHVRKSFCAALLEEVASHLMHCYCIHNRSFVVRISHSVVCPPINLITRLACVEGNFIFGNDQYAQNTSSNSRH